MPLTARIGAATLLLLLAAAVAAAPAPTTSDCTDDRGVDRCAAEQHRRVLELFAVSPIERHREAGDQVRRAFYVDGYGRDIVAIAFVRGKGGNPTLWVHFPPREDGKRAPPMQAAVPHSVWEVVLARSEIFDRSLAPPSTPSEDVIICMHSWVYTVEAADPPRWAYYPGELRRKTEDACDDGPAEVYATDLARVALPLLPACAVLDPKQHRNEASTIAACSILGGDRIAAAQALNQANRLRLVDGAGDAALLRGVIGYEASIEWNGERNSGSGSAGPFWARKASEGGRANLYVESVVGEALDRVRLTGHLSRSSEGADGESVYHRAKVTQIWTSDPHGDFTLESATVGPFELQR